MIGRRARFQHHLDEHWLTPDFPAHLKRGCRWCKDWLQDMDRGMRPRDPANVHGAWTFPDGVQPW